MTSDSMTSEAVMQGDRCDGLIQIRAPRALIQTAAGEARKRELTFSSFVRRAVERELVAGGVNG